jgi:hypothetical protein
MRFHPVVLLLAAILCAFTAQAFAADPQPPDIAYAKRMFAGTLPKPKAYACFVRRYDAVHLAQHPLQKVSVMKLLIAAEYDTDFKAYEYSFRLGVTFRDRPGDFDSSGECGKAAAMRSPDTDAPVAAGIDFECDVDCDGGGVTVNLANNDGAVIVKLPERIRIWKGKNADEAAMTALMAGADDKIFRLDRAAASECTALVTNRKELAAMRHK